MEEPFIKALYGVAVFVNVGKGFDRPVEGIVLGGDEFALDDDGDGFIENHIPLGRTVGVAAKFIAAGDKQPAAVVVLSIIVNDPHIRVTLLMQDPHSAMRFQGRLPGRRTTDLHHEPGQHMFLLSFVATGLDHFHKFIT